MLESQGNEKVNLFDEFYIETKIRLLADKVRVHGITARLADDQFNEYVGLEKKKNYIENRISNAEHVLNNLRVDYRENKKVYESISASRDYILNGSCEDDKKKGLVANFYHESKFKSANDELTEALQELQIAVQGSSKNQQNAKPKMAKVLFGLREQSAEVCSVLADYFVKQGLCEYLIKNLQARSEIGEAKWKREGALVVNGGKISQYCNVKLTSQDYYFTAKNAMILIRTFVQNNLAQFEPQKKKSKFIGKISNFLNQIMHRVS